MLHAIEPTVNVINVCRLPRRDDIIIHRLRIGHKYLMDSWGSLRQCSELDTRILWTRRGVSLSAQLVKSN